MKYSVILICFFIFVCNNNSGESDELIAIVFERGGNSYGYPSYKAEIYSNGFVDFSNIQNVKNLNSLKKNISRIELNQIIFLFKKSAFSEFKDRYSDFADCPKHLSHAQSIHISYISRLKTKKVMYLHSCGGSEELEKLANIEKIIDKTINTDAVYSE